MHDILEGALQHEIKIMLKKMIEVKQYSNLGKSNNIYIYILLYIYYIYIYIYNIYLFNNT